MTLPCASTILTTTATTGLISSTASIQANSVLNFSTRIGDLWSEYVITGINIKVTPLQTTASGVTTFFFSDSSTAVPTLNESQGRVVHKLSNSAANPQSTRTFSWKARSLSDLTFQLTSFSYTAANFKCYTDATNYGAPVVATPLWLVEPEIQFTLRGLRSV